ncbi:hypothetical protein D9M70_434020 [compost metagenome]
MTAALIVGYPGFLKGHLGRLSRPRQAWQLGLAQLHLRVNLHGFAMLQIEESSLISRGTDTPALVHVCVGCASDELFKCAEYHVAGGNPHVCFAGIDALS